MLRVVLLKDVDMSLPQIRISAKVCQGIWPITTEKNIETPIQTQIKARRAFCDSHAFVTKSPANARNKVLK